MTKLSHFQTQKGRAITKRRTRVGSEYNTCEGKHMQTCQYDEPNERAVYTVQHMRPWKHDWEVSTTLATKKLEREVYTTLATTKTWAGSVYNTCGHENTNGKCIQHLLPRNLSGKCIQHLLPRKLEREVYTTLATTTYESSACSTCKHENYRGQCIEQLQTQNIYAGSAYNNWKHENLSERHLPKEQTSACSYDCTKAFINFNNYSRAKPDNIIKLKHYMHHGLSIYQNKYCETTFLAYHACPT